MCPSVVQEPTGRTRRPAAATQRAGLQVCSVVPSRFFLLFVAPVVSASLALPSLQFHRILDRFGQLLNLGCLLNVRAKGTTDFVPFHVLLQLLRKLSEA